MCCVCGGGKQVVKLFDSTRDKIILAAVMLLIALVVGFFMWRKKRQEQLDEHEIVGIQNKRNQMCNLHAAGCKNTGGAVKKGGGCYLHVCQFALQLWG